MLLLVPAQKNEGDRSDKRNPFSIDPANSSHASSSASSSQPTSGRVLVVLPPRTDMSSTLIVSDKTITTALTTTLHSCLSQPCGDLEQISDSTTRTYRPRHEDAGEIKDAMVERSRLYGSLSQAGNRSRPTRRHSYFRSSAGEHCNMRWSTHPRSRSRTNRTTSSSRQKSCTTTTTSSTNTTTTSTTTANTTTGRSLSPHPPYSDSQRFLREAFKKTMTVQSPLLTSTSSGMVLDLTPGPALESRWKDVETKTQSSLSFEAAAVANSPTDGERQKAQVGAKSKPVSEQESSSGESESSSSERGTSMDMSDAEDKSLDKNDEEEDEAHDDDAVDKSNNNDDLGPHIKVEPLEDERSLPSTAFSIQEAKRTSSKGISGTLAPTIPRADLLESAQQKEVLARSCLGARSKSISSISSSSFSSPVLPRIPTRPPSAPLPALAGQDALMTAQDIAFGTASVGALTPIEIQRRMYEHSQFRAPSRWPTYRRRRSAGVCLEGRSKVEPLSLLSSSSLQTQPTPFPFPFPLRNKQASAACSVPERVISGGVGAGGGGAGGGSDNHNNHNGSFVPELPSYYYLPPSAFRTAATVAAEEQQEAEHRRKKEQEEKEREENSFFEFPSPSPSPPSQASPSS